MNEKFDLKKIYNITSEQNFSLGENIYKSGATDIYDHSILVEPKKDNFYEIFYQAYTYGTSYNEYDQNMHLIFKNNKLINARGFCNCTLEQDVCKHQVSALLTFLNNQSIEELAQSKGIKIEFENENIAEIIKYLDYEKELNVSYSKKYEIIPYFSLNKGKVFLSIKIKEIGKSEYIVKNLEELSLNFKAKAKDMYGSNTIIEHFVKYFKNEQLVDDILNIIDNRINFIHDIEENYDYIIEHPKKKVSLEGVEFNELFNLLDGKVNFKVDNVFENFTIINKYNKIQFDVNVKKTKTFIKPLNKYSTFISDELIYIFNLKAKEVCKLNCKTKANAKMLQQMLDTETIIEEKNLYTFKYSVLDRLKSYITFMKPLEVNTDKYNLINSKTDLTLQAENLYVTHYYLETENSEFDILPIEKIKNLKAITKAYSDEYDQSTDTFVIKDIHKVLKYLNEGLEEVSKHSDEILENDELRNFDIVSDFEIDYNLSISNNSVLLDFKSSTFDQKELLEILKSLKDNKPYYRLDNKSFVYLEDDNINKIKNLADKLNVDLGALESSSMKFSSYNALYLDVLLNDLNLKFYKEKKLAQMIEQIQDFKNQKLDVSKNVKAELRDYQQVGINWLNTLKKYNLNGILADDMGLGKTLQVISLLSSIKTKKPVLIVAPASLLYNWENEILKFNNKLSYKLVVGTPKERSGVLKSATQGILITSYNLLKKDIDLYKEINYEYVILDEGQNIKNKSSQTTKAIKLLKSDHNLVLTGTPIENNLSELWSIFDFLMPGYLGSYLQFKKNYENEIVKNNSDALQNLQRKISPFILRRLKTEVLKELPSKQEQILYMEMPTEQRKIYDAQVLEIKNMLINSSDKEFNQNRIELLSKITKLRQIVCNPSLIYSEYNKESIKSEILIENLLELKANGHKVLVFSQFVSNFDHLEEKLAENNLSYYRIDGTTPKIKRHILVDDFNKDTTDVFLISLKAGGTGLNIVGADTVIHYDPWWNTAVEAQATDRVHRIGQKKNVLVYKYICKNTIEEKILLLQETKKDLANNLLDSENTNISKMKKEDFLNLFD